MTQNELSRRDALKLAGAAGAFAVAPGVASARGDGVDRPELNELRQATATYHDPSKAEDAGYVRDHHCVADSGRSGAMGFHYVDRGSIDTTQDHTDPEVLDGRPSTSAVLDGSRESTRCRTGRCRSAGPSTAPSLGGVGPKGNTGSTCTPIAFIRERGRDIKARRPE